MNRREILTKLAMELAEWPTTEGVHGPAYFIPSSKYYGPCHPDTVVTSTGITSRAWLAERERVWRAEHGFVQVDTAEDEAFADLERKLAEGQKFDTDKPLMSLLPPKSQLAVARVLTFGARKYSPENWRQVLDLQRRYLDAALRHINAVQCGETDDAESGEHHYAHAICCLMFMLEDTLLKGAHHAK